MTKKKSEILFSAWKVLNDSWLFTCKNEFRLIWVNRENSCIHVSILCRNTSCTLNIMTSGWIFFFFSPLKTSVCWISKQMVKNAAAAEEDLKRKPPSVAVRLYALKIYFPCILKEHNFSILSSCSALWWTSVIFNKVTWRSMMVFISC